MSYTWSEWKEVQLAENAFTIPNRPQVQAMSVRNEEGGAEPSGTISRQLNPYVHWAINGPGEDDIADTRDPSLLKLLPEVDARQVPEMFKPFVGLLDSLPIPKHAAPGQDGGDPKIKFTPPPEDKLPSDSDLEVIAGVIDVGIPLGHRATRFKSGNSRILAAWQMLGGFDSAGTAPFGAELYRGEIDGLLRQYSGGAQSGWLDEAGFNTATGALSVPVQGGQRDLGARASHGAHVLHAMAGELHGEDCNCRKVGIIAINAPAASTFGANGTYLDQFIFHGIKRIVEIADATWHKNNRDPAEGAIKGYPIVINMAFGKQSGSKDVFDVFGKALAQFNAYRKANGLSRVHFVMPAGNDNATQSNAFLEPDKDETLELGWRIMPQDQSSNFVELWAEDAQAEGAEVPIVAGLAHPQVSVPLAPLPVQAETYFFSDLTSDDEFLARVYMKRHRGEFTPHKSEKKIKYRVQYIFCIAPTLRFERKPQKQISGAPGLWTISVRNRSERRRSCVLSIQTDQGLTPNRSINRRSYFEHPGYRKYDDMGRLKDSYSYPPDAGGGVENLDIADDTPIRRHGTMLATGASASFARVGGYRASDGRPAFYSSTGRGRDDGSDDGTQLGFERGKEQRSAPTAALPTEDGAALFGILSAGSADGSMVAMRGTSFATPQASRLIIEHLLEDLRSASSGSGILRALAARSETRASGGSFPKAPPELIEVLGAGRIRGKRRARIARAGGSD